MEMNEMKDKSRIKQLINDFKSCRYCCLRIIEINQKLEVMNHMILGLSHSVQNLSREQQRSNLPMPKYNKHYTSPVAMLYEIEKLELNKKTRIYTSKSNFNFLGRNKFGRYAKYRLVKRKLKKRFYLYRNGEINLYSLSSSIDNFKRLGRIKM